MEKNVIIYLSLELGGDMMKIINNYEYRKVINEFKNIENYIDGLPNKEEKINQLKFIKQEFLGRMNSEKSNKDMNFTGNLIKGAGYILSAFIGYSVVQDKIGKSMNISLLVAGILFVIGIYIMWSCVASNFTVGYANNIEMCESIINLIDIKMDNIVNDKDIKINYYYTRLY